MTFQRYSFSIGVFAASLVSPSVPCGAFAPVRPAIVSRPCINSIGTTSEAGTMCRRHSMLAAEVVNGGRGSMKSQKEDDPNPSTEEELRRNADENWATSTLRRLAQLSLEDYEWRSSVLKSKEADRKVDDVLARMMGEDPSYVRPMDAGDKKIGPLGMFEKSVVEWLTETAEAEARRAKQIVDMGGSLVRPKDTTSQDGEIGPLGFMEKQFVDFMASIRRSERERSRTRTLRPKDLDESERGPLGEAELRAVEAIREIIDSEQLRMAQSRARGGGVVRPIDVPGPFGEFEMAVLDLVKAEQQRRDEGREYGKPVRPMNSAVKSPLGELEKQAVEVVQKLTEEEKERLRSWQRVLESSRPMSQDKITVLGVIETIFVGLIRAPILIYQIIMRVIELLNSKPMSEEDARIVEQIRQEQQTRGDDRASTKDNIN